MVKHFEYRSSDVAAMKARVGLLDTLVHEYNCDVIVVSGQHRDGSPMGLRAAWRLVESTPLGGVGPARALESLVLVDAGRWLGCAQAGDRRHPAAAPGRAVFAQVIDEESRCDRHLQGIWQGLNHMLQQRSLGLAEQGREELLDVMGERAEPYYREIWESCRRAERAVLVHLADSGLVNEKDRRVLRRLLARGLIRREPNFVIMNETFRRYLLGRAGEVEAVTSGPPSTWDAVRKPVLAAGTGVAILLLVSQQELFSATTAVVTALGTGAATISKLTGLFDRRAPGGRDA